MLVAIASLVPSLVPVTPSAPAAQGQLPAVKTQVIATDLSYPVCVTSPPGDSSRLFIVEQPGRIRLHQGGQLLATPFLDLVGQVQFFSEQGLLGLAFHPDFAANGLFYVFYNDVNGDTVLERYTAIPPTAAVADPLSAQLVLKLAKPFEKHNGGMLAFGPTDGMLYVSTGDGGGEHDPFGNAQSLDSLLGKILRLDVDGGTPYAVPADNPFVGVPGARGEIYALGLRNPWRYGVDRQTGALFVGDVGGLEREEIDYLPPGGGLNFGWDCEEGAVCGDQPECAACPDPVFTPSVQEYDHNTGCAIIGGPPYRGAALPAFDGRVFYSDYCTARIWSFAFDGTTASDLIDHSAELSPPGGLGLMTSFGQDADGEIYLTSFYPGTVRKLVPAEGVPDCDADGVPDSEELIQGEHDVNANGIPDSCELLLSSTDFVTGQQATIDFIGAAPGDPVAIVWSTRGIGGGPCFFGGAWCLSLLPMASITQPIGLLGVTFAKADGSAQAKFVVPDYTGTKLVAVQAVVIKLAVETSLVSNPIQKVIL
jgi:glucose/arabinose dehydrogenase